MNRFCRRDLLVPSQTRVFAGPLSGLIRASGLCRCFRFSRNKPWLGRSQKLQRGSGQIITQYAWHRKHQDRSSLPKQYLEMSGLIPGTLISLIYQLLVLTVRYIHTCQRPVS